MQGAAVSEPWCSEWKDFHSRLGHPSLSLILEDILDKSSYKKLIWASYDCSVPVSEFSLHLDEKWFKSDNTFYSTGGNIGTLLFRSDMGWNKYVNFPWVRFFVFPSIAIFYAVMLYVELYKKERLPKISAFPNSMTDTIYAMQMENGTAWTLL